MPTLLLAIKDNQFINEQGGKSFIKSTPLSKQ